MHTPAKILVTGDYGLDYDIYLHSDEDNPPPQTHPAQVGVSIGGAGIALRVLKAAEAQLAATAASGTDSPTIEVGFSGKPDSVTSPPTAALWQKFKFGKMGKPPSNAKTEVWRIRRSLSLGDVADAQSHPSAKLPEMVKADFDPKVVLIEDNAGGYRFQVPEWLRIDTNGNLKHVPEWIVLKTSAPLCHGAFWWALSRPKECRDRLVVVVSLRDLRTSEIRVSHGISWERTAQDLVRELSQSPLLEGLRQVRHVIVTAHGEGALWMERLNETGPNGEQHRFTLLFDPGHIEGEWSQDILGADGNAYGFQSTLAASVALHLGLKDRKGMMAGIDNGMRAMRLLRAMGHGEVKKPELGKPMDTPQLPAEALALVVLSSDLKKLPAILPRMPMADLAKLGAFSQTDIPQMARLNKDEKGHKHEEGHDPSHASWRILESSDIPLSPGQPLYGLGRRVALLGLDGLRDVPYANFGKLFTADRDEIEALRNIQRLMQDYENNKEETKPLSISVFGPPGSGKSFAVKQIAETALRGKKSFLEFNLSQFKDSFDLIGAFHQVRDKVLEGGTPIVFWDEFDSQNYKWLQYLLAPMQDGRFQEGQITHPIGRCIFVFAGATCYDIQNFGPLEKPSSKDESGSKDHKQATTDFKLKKGPDFKSRLHGNLNVLGPNRRQLFISANPPGEQWVDDLADTCFPVRRAILLRSWLGLMDPTKNESRSRLDMDPGLLAALIEVGHYTHGARSMEKLINALKQDGKRGYHRSTLPNNEVLEMNIRNLEEFMQIMDQPRAFQQQAWRLAPAIHAAWFKLGAQGNAYRVDFKKLAEEAKGDNYAAALRIPSILGLVGLQLVEKRDSQPAISDKQVTTILEDHIELLAEEEHEGWMKIKLANGWKPAGPPKDKAEQSAQREEFKHHCLVPYGKLSEHDKHKDRLSIMHYPRVAKLAGFKIVARKPLRS